MLRHFPWREVLFGNPRFSGVNHISDEHRDKEATKFE